jgi:carbonic anhydrase
MNLYEELANHPFIQYLTDVKLSDGLLNGEIPSAMLVSFSDTGARLPYVCSSAEANLLTFQNFGHKTEGIAEQVLYSQVHNVIVYRHTDCKFMRFLVKSDESGHAEKGLIAKWFASESEAAMASNAGKTTTWKQIIELHVLAELKALLLNKGLLKSAENLKVILHAWVYDAERCELDVYEPKERRFIPANQRIALQS